MINDLLARGNYLFDKKFLLNTLHQTIAENFYPERADFTVTRNLGEELCENLYTSIPIMARRELGNAFSTMLRPSGEDWFEMTADEWKVDGAGKQWLERSAKIQRRAMYDRASQFTRAAKECDHDYAAFGQGVISVDYIPATYSLLYRNWHLKDVAWSENSMRVIDEVHRKWRPTLREVVGLFPKTVNPRMREQAEKEPYCEAELRHIVMPGEYREKTKDKFPFVSIYLDVENNIVLEEVGRKYFPYVIPRWQTLSNSQYAHSPAVVAALPDARLIQAMMMLLLEAGEKATNPPLIAQEGILQGGAQLFAGGISIIDAQYDERLGEALRPMNLDLRGLNFGSDMFDRTRAAIGEAFYLNKLSLPPITGMTATEATYRVQEHIRQTLPLFEPIEQDYNGALCETTFNLMLSVGGFGPMRDIPESLLGSNIDFKFSSPISDASRQKNTTRYNQAVELLMQGAQVDPNIAANLDINKAFRDALEGIRSPTGWLVPPEVVEQQLQAKAQQQQMAQAANMINQGAMAAEQVGKADQAMAGMEA